jgi:hypothetical protein
MGPFDHFERPDAVRTTQPFLIQVKGHAVTVHEVAHFSLAQKDIRQGGVIGNEKAVSIPVGLNPAHDDLTFWRQAVMPPVEFDDQPLGDQLLQSPM